VQVADVTVIVTSAIGVCFLATIYPARQAGRLDPAEALRNQ
jgi:lipoprotein-releasing system permease protein